MPIARAYNIIEQWRTMMNSEYIVINPFRCLHFARIHYACTCYWLAETEQTFFATAFFIRTIASATTYYSNLNSDHRKKFEEEIITADGTILPDPYALVEHWKDNVKLLPDITRVDIYNYLINTPSLYMNKNLKAYNSLEAYNFFTSGNVHDVAYQKINNFFILTYSYTVLDQNGRVNSCVF